MFGCIRTQPQFSWGAGARQEPTSSQWQGRPHLRRSTWFCSLEVRIVKIGWNKCCNYVQQYYNHISYQSYQSYLCILLVDRWIRANIHMFRPTVTPPDQGALTAVLLQLCRFQSIYIIYMYIFVEFSWYFTMFSNKRWSNIHACCKLALHMSMLHIQVQGLFCH